MIIVSFQQRQNAPSEKRCVLFCFALLIYANSNLLSNAVQRVCKNAITTDLNTHFPPDAIMDVESNFRQRAGVASLEFRGQALYQVPALHRLRLDLRQCR